MEHCVTRRGAIFMVAEARQSKSKASEDKTRINYTRKLDDIRNKIKQLETEVKTVQEKMFSLGRRKQMVEQEIDNNKRDIAFCESYAKTLRDEIEKRKTNRQLKFEILVMMQRQLNVYRDLTLKRSPFLHTKRDHIQSEYYYQKDINNKLSSVLQNLMSDFPNYHHELTRLYNTLKLSVYTQFSSHLDLRMNWIYKEQWINWK